MTGYLRGGFCALSLVITLAGRAQTDGMLQGVIQDARTLAPVEGAAVLVTGTLAGTLTDAEGQFVLGPIRAGWYALVVTASGFQDHTQQVRILADSTVNLRLNLSAAYKEVRRFSPLVDVPAWEGGPAEPLASRLVRLPGVIPIRSDGINVTPGVRGLNYRRATLYIDGIRQLEAAGREPTVMMSSVGQVFMAGGPYAAYWGPRGQGGWYITRLEERIPGVEFAYDTRLRSFRTGAIYSRSLPKGYGELSGVYHRAGNYTDADGTLHPGAHKAGLVQLRGHRQLGGRHRLEGQGSVRLHSGHAAKNEQSAGYRHSSSQGLLERVVIQLARQQWTGSLAVDQHIGRVAIRLRPQRAWRADAGLEFVGMPGVREESAFARLARAGERVALMMTGRADRVLLDGWPNYGWHLQSSVNWRLARSADLIAGIGRSDNFDLLGIARTVQTDLGLRLSRTNLIARVRGWMRRQSASKARGMDAHLVASALSDLIKVTITATATDHPSLPAVWGRFGTHWEAPGRILQFSASLDAAARTDHSNAWLMASAWLQFAGWRQTKLRVTAVNLFDRQFAWPALDAVSAIPEPGRSLKLAVHMGL